MERQFSAALSWTISLSSRVMIFAIHACHRDVAGSTALPPRDKERFVEIELSGGVSINGPLCQSIGLMSESLHLQMKPASAFPKGIMKTLQKRTFVAAAYSSLFLSGCVGSPCDGGNDSVPYRGNDADFGFYGGGRFQSGEFH